MNKKTILPLAITLALALNASAQTAADTRHTAAWSMDSCMSYAVKHSTDVQLQLVERRQARADYRWAKAGFLPQVGANVSTQWSWGRGINPETNVYTNVTTFNNYYNLYASLTVFDGMRTVNAFRQARLLRRSSDAAVAKARDAKAIEVMQLYAEAAYAQASIELAAQKLNESRQLLTRTQRMMELGTKSRPDVAQVEAQVAEDDYALTHQRNEATRTLLALKTAMNYPADSTLAISTDPSLLFSSSATNATKGGYTTKDAAAISASFQAISPEVATAVAEERSARYTWLQQRGALLPTISLEGGISTNYYKNLSQKGSVDAFATQIKNNRGEYFGISLSIPIFNASSWKAARRAKSSWQQAQLKLDDTRRRLHDNIFQAVMDRDGYAKETVQMERKVLSDSLAHHLNARKYDEGMLSTFELHTSSQTLLQSKIKLLQMQMLLAIKQRLVEYYKCGRLNVE